MAPGLRRYISSSVFRQSCGKCAVPSSKTEEQEEEGGEKDEDSEDKVIVPLGPAQWDVLGSGVLSSQFLLLISTVTFWMPPGPCCTFTVLCTLLDVVAVATSAVVAGLVADAAGVLLRDEICAFSSPGTLSCDVLLLG